MKKFFHRQDTGENLEMKIICLVVNYCLWDIKKKRKQSSKLQGVEIDYNTIRNRGLQEYVQKRGELNVYR